jgi:hypothetical protein
MTMQEQFESAQKEGKAERITASRVVLKEKDVVFGRYLGRDLIESKDKKMKSSYSYRFEGDTGPFTMFMSSAFDDKHGESMQEGALYRVEYKGKLNISGGHTFKDFDVRKVVSVNPQVQPISGPREAE